MCLLLFPSPPPSASTSTSSCCCSSQTREMYNDTYNEAVHTLPRLQTWPNPKHTTHQHLSEGNIHLYFPCDCKRCSHTIMIYAVSSFWYECKFKVIEVSLISRRKSLFFTFLKDMFFIKCHLSICTDVYLCRLDRPSCWRHCVTVPHHMTAVPAYLRCTTCACLCSHTGHWLRCRWGILIGGQRITPSKSEWLCLRAVQVHPDTGWGRCINVYELEVVVFSHESERQEVLAGQLRVSTNMKTLIKNRVESILEVGQRVIHTGSTSV